MARTIPLDDLQLAPRGSSEGAGPWFDRALRAAIRSGRLRANSRLPSSRRLSQRHAVSRGTVLQVFAQLTTEGYLEARAGSGTYVSSHLPDQFFTPQSIHAKTKSTQARLRSFSLSPRALRLTQSPFLGIPMKGPPRAFRPYLPAVDHFPVDVWARLSSRCARRVTREQLLTQDEFGWLPLRKAIAGHLASSRGVMCEPDQIMVVSGTQQALDFVGRLLIEPGDSVLMEDPGYPGATALFSAQGARVVPVAVDEQGMKIEVGLSREPTARMVYLTPANQFPLGSTLSLERRIQISEWSIRRGGWVFEDDYDSEFRFEGQPLAALQGINPSARVIYSCSFNKMLFPTLRLGFLLLPQALVEPARAARSLLDRYPPALEQMILCDFISEGHFGRHLRRMRQVYAERHAALVHAVHSQLSGVFSLSPCTTGLQAVGWLPPSHVDHEVAARLRESEVEAVPLSRFALKWPGRQGLHLGFGAVQTDEIKRGIAVLERILG